MILHTSKQDRRRALNAFKKIANLSFLLLRAPTPRQRFLTAIGGGILMCGDIVINGDWIRSIEGDEDRRCLFFYFLFQRAWDYQSRDQMQIPFDTQPSPFDTQGNTWEWFRTVLVGCHSFAHSAESRNNASFVQSLDIMPEFDLTPIIIETTLNMMSPVTFLSWKKIPLYQRRAPVGADDQSLCNLQEWILINTVFFHQLAFSYLLNHFLPLICFDLEIPIIRLEQR